MKRGRSPRNLRTGGTSSILCSARREGVSVSVDGRKIVDWKGRFNRLSNFPDSSVNNPQALYLCANQSKVAFSKIVLTPVSGRGEKLR